MASAVSANEIRCFQDLLGAVDRQRFLDDYYGQRHLHVRGDPERFASILTLDEVEELMAKTGFWDTRSLAMAKASRGLDEREFCIAAKDRFGETVQRPHPAKVAQQLREGASLVLDHIDRMTPGVRRVTEAVEAALVEPLTATGFVSWKRVQGYGLHFDSQEVIALQLHGRKTWRLYSGRYDAPLDEVPGFNTLDMTPEQKAEQLGEVAAQIEMGPGDLLYVPAGQWHGALAQDEVSLHVSLGIRRPTGFQLLETMREALPQLAEVRRPFPHPDRMQANARHLRDMANAMQSALCTDAMPQQAARFQKSKAFALWGDIEVFDRRAPQRFRVRWPYASLEGASYRPAERPPVALPPEAAKLAAWLWRQDTVDDRQLLSGPLSQQALQQAVPALVQAGVLEPMQL